jgi:hypothetical protein
MLSSLAGYLADETETESRRGISNRPIEQE